MIANQLERIAALAHSPMTMRNNFAVIRFLSALLLKNLFYFSTKSKNENHNSDMLVCKMEYGCKCLPSMDLPYADKLTNPLLIERQRDENNILSAPNPQKGEYMLLPSDLIVLIAALPKTPKGNVV